VSPVTATFTGGGLKGVTPAPGVQRPSGGIVPKVGPGQCVFVTASPALTLVCKLGASSATLKGGVGGWDDVPRPGRINGVEWTGLPALVLTIPLLFDGLAGRDSIETGIATLYAMGRPPLGTPRGTPPPTIRVGGMVPHGDIDWVLTGLEEGEAVWDGRRRIRLYVTVTLTQLVTLDLVKVTAKKAGATPATKTHVVRGGESLGSIARDEMGASSASAVAAAVRKLKALNGLRDAKAIRPGMRLKVPR
jgi:LysM repeat protein